jgi:hypothetical protein
MNTENQNKWFIQLKGNIQGPFSNETLSSTLNGLGSENIQIALVWKRGLSEWIKAGQWQKADLEIAAQARKKSVSMDPSNSLFQMDSNQSLNFPKTSSNVENLSNEIPKFQLDEIDQFKDLKDGGDEELFEKTFTQAFSEGVFYRVQVNFVDQPLMSKNELSQLISKTEDVSTISIQDPKSKEWKEIYSFPDLVEKFGISRRKSNRVPILAQFNGSSSKSKACSYRVITISEGGMGFTENFELKIGDEVDGQISSPHFFHPISVKADVIYAGLDGYIGLKFSSITDEAKSAIVEYVRKFGKNSQKS